MLLSTDLHLICQELEVLQLADSIINMNSWETTKKVLNTQEWIERIDLFSVFKIDDKGLFGQVLLVCLAGTSNTGHWYTSQDSSFTRVIRVLTFWLKKKTQENKVSEKTRTLYSAGCLENVTHINFHF